MKKLFLFTMLAILPLFAMAKEYLVHEWEKIRLTNEFWAEGADSGDFNKDGHGDVAYGPYWFEGPTFEKRHEFRPATESFELKKPDKS